MLLCSVGTYYFVARPLHIYVIPTPSRTLIIYIYVYTVASVHRNNYHHYFRPVPLFRGVSGDDPVAAAMAAGEPPFWCCLAGEDQGASSSCCCGCWGCCWCTGVAVNGTTMHPGSPVAVATALAAAAAGESDMSSSRGHRCYTPRRRRLLLRGETRRRESPVNICAAKSVVVEIRKKKNE